MQSVTPWRCVLWGADSSRNSHILTFVSPKPCEQGLINNNPGKSLPEPREALGGHEAPPGGFRVLSFKVLGFRVYSLGFRV